MTKGKKIALGAVIGILVLCAFVYSGLSTNPMEKVQNTDKIEVFLSQDENGNRKSKTITNPDEIAAMLEAFETGVVGEEVTPPPGDPNLSEYYLYYKDEKLNSFIFLGDDSYTAMVQPKFFKITYTTKTPYELYQASQSPEKTLSPNE